jgi:predicted KAP-like P-loop ATPase
MVADELKGSSVSHKPIVIWFNPWHFKTTDDLIRAFFRALHFKESSSGKEQIGKALDALAFVATVGDITPAAPITKSVAKGLKWASKLLRGSADTKSPDDLKNEVNKYLSKMEGRLIVVVDDIDRLEPDSLKTMLRMIRLTASFDNTTYILAFDQVVVDAMLRDSGRSSSGKDYLEKIIQVGFHLPPPDASKLQRLLLEQVDSLLKSVHQDDWDDSYWQEVFLGGLRQFIKTPRDVVRFSNAARLNLQFMNGELNPVDQLGLEAIRTFAPKAYEFLRDNRDLVLGPVENYGSAPAEDREAVKSTIEQAWSKDDEQLELHIQRLCRVLFPSIRRVDASGTIGWPEAEWRVNRRIASRDFYNRYFFLGVPEGEITESELSTILQLSDRDLVTNRLRQLIVEGRISRFLERLEDYTATIPEPVIVGLGLFLAAVNLTWRETIR